MPNVIFPDEGLASLLGALIEYPMASGFHFAKMMLWVNNLLVPSRDTVYADLTEASFAGYGRIDMVGSIHTWSAPAVVSHDASTEADPVTFTCSLSGTAQHIYGWAIVDDAHSKLLAIAPLSAPPITIDTTGQTVTITPTLKMSSAYSTP